MPNARLAVLARPSRWAVLFKFPLRLQLEVMNRKSVVHRSLVANPGTELPQDTAHVYARNFEVPSGGGVTSARGLARAYSAFAGGDDVLGISTTTVDLLAAPAVPPTHGFYDECMHGEVKFSLGFMKPSRFWPFGGERSFGSPGAGGSMGFADPDAQVGYGYVTSRMGTTLTGDPRDVALRDALYKVIRPR